MYTVINAFGVISSNFFNFNLGTNSRGLPDPKTNNDRVAIGFSETDSLQSTEELTIWFDLTIPTILTHIILLCVQHYLFRFKLIKIAY